jgi:hypothetical protein
VLVFVIGSVALFLGATAGSIAGTILGIIGWIAAIGLLVYWIMGKKTAVQ